jgi:acyl dehydratase
MSEPEQGASIITAEARAWAERDHPSVEVTVSRADIMRFAYATGERDPIHFDLAAARAAGHRDLPAPPMFCVSLRISTFTLRPTDELEPDGWPSEDVPPLPTRRGMAGNTALTLHGDIYAGDQVRVGKRLTGMAEKHGRSGPLVLLTFEYRYETERGLAAVELFTRILR